MEEKPVIIIGGGLWGTLLALRIRQCLPHVALKLYAPGPQLGEQFSVSFHESDVSQAAMKWLSPFISQSWKDFEVNFPRYSKKSDHKLFTMEPSHFHAVASELLGPNVVYLNRTLTPEEAVKEGSFVIDTLVRGYFKGLGYQKTHGLIVKLTHPHRLSSPISMDATIEQKNGFRYLQVLPLSEERLLLKDVRFSSDPLLYYENIEPDLFREAHQRRWIIDDVLERETEFRKIPCDYCDQFFEGKVIRLDGFVHDITGDALPDAVRLIDRMVQTSFRLGELKLVMREYLIERKSRRRIFRTINRMLFRVKTPCAERYQFFQWLHSMPPSIRKKFYKGDLVIIDILRSLYTKSFFSRQKTSGISFMKNQERVVIV